MDKFFIKVTILIFGLVYLGGFTAYASENYIPDFEPFKVEEKIENEINDAFISERIYIEVFEGVFDEEYIINMLLEDGTRIKDHDYIITYIKPSTRNSALEARLALNFHFAGWVTRNGVVSLRLDTSNFFRTSTRSARIEIWDSTIEPIFSSDRRWDNPRVMRQQYVCHVDFAPNQASWHLEPHRTSLGHWNTVMRLCNP